MKQLKKTILTLALLLTAATSAWAESKPIGLNVEYEVDDMITSTTDVYVFCTNHEYSQAIVLSSSQSATIKEIQPTGISFDEFFNLYFLSDGSQRELYIADGIEFVSPVGQGDPLPTKVYVASGNGTWQDPYVFAPGPAASGTPVPLTWDAATPNTATLTNGMPAGNVTVSVEYFPQAELATSTGESPVALAPAAIASVPANTDDPIVTAGTVANIGTSEVKQGTLKYFVKQADGNTAPTAPDYDDDGWTDKVPTADGLAQGKAYVWYYIEGAEPASIADRTDDNTRSDSDIKAINASGFVAVGPEPTYDVSLNKTGLDEGEPAKWKAKSDNQTEVILGTNDLEGVKKGETVTVTYTGSRKVIGVKAEKKPAAPTSYTIVAGNDIKSTNVTTFPFQFTHLNQNTMYGMTAEVVGGDGKVSATVNVMNGCVNITVTGAFDTDAIVYVMEQGKTKEDATWSFPVICKVNK